jgi:hypothetical protein
VCEVYTFEKTRGEQKSKVELRLIESKELVSEDHFGRPLLILLNDGKERRLVGKKLLVLAK